MGATLSLKVEDILNKFSRNKRCNGLNSVVRIQAHSTAVCKLLKRLVPGAGFEPAPSYEERILSPFEDILPDLTKRDEPIFTGLAAVKVTFRPVTSPDRMSSS